MYPCRNCLYRTLPKICRFYPEAKSSKLLCLRGIPSLLHSQQFRCRENAWHGHKQFVGERRSIQLNWVVSDAAVRRSQFVHGISSFLKRLRMAG